MRKFQEFKGQSFRLDYDRDRAGFVIKTEPHPFLLNLQRAIGVGRSRRAQPVPGFFLGMFRRVSSQ
jgi:hypothetical protein